MELFGCNFSAWEHYDQPRMKDSHKWGYASVVQD